MSSVPVCVMRIITVSGYLSGKMTGKALVARGFELPWVKEKHRPFYQKPVLTLAES